MTRLRDRLPELKPWSEMELPKIKLPDLEALIKKLKNPQERANLILRWLMKAEKPTLKEDP